jgi:imidazolonepropionase
LNVEDELKMLRAIQHAASQTHASLVPTCLAAHTLPKDFPGNHQAYLHFIIQELLPLVRTEGLAKRVDIFIEESAFQPAAALQYLNVCRDMGFQVTVHADQFTTGGSKVAVEANALSADHLEASTEKELQMMANSNTVAVVLPGASMGLGMPFANARKLLDIGACVAIGTDWNPGSAPMGDLLMQAAVMGASEKLTTAETFAGITCRAAHALGLHERGVIVPGFRAHMQAYPTHDYRDILYYQGTLKPCRVWA